MKKSRNKPLDFVIDKLTNSVENTSTGEVFNTEIVRLTLKDLKQIHKAEWQFDWTKEIKDKTKEVYKLTTVNNSTIIQGLISIEDKQDHIFMHLIESAKFNKNKNKVYLGVPGNLVAYACKVSVDYITKNRFMLLICLCHYLLWQIPDGTFHGDDDTSYLLGAHFCIRHSRSSL